MKAPKKVTALILLACLAATSGALGTGLNSGNDLKQLADSSDRTRTSPNTSIPDYMDDSLFTGYVQGIIAALNSVPAYFCVPIEVTYGQARNVVTLYVRKHPEKLHLPAGEIVVAALGEAFPCKK